MTNKHTTESWLRDGNCVYTLMHAGWKRGIEQFKNKFFIQVQVDRSCDNKEAEKIAQLIAAAPELLEALQRLLKADSDPYLTEQGLRNLARKAIAKAIGETN